MPKIRDVAGQVFGKLTAQAVDGKDSTGKTRWLCMCACGNTTTATMLNLVKGVTKSCGCLRNGPSANRLNLAGKRFGRLTALKPVSPLKWECLCDCGVITLVRTVHLSRHHTQSCGCIRATADPAKAALYKMRNQRSTWSARVKKALGAVCASCGSVDKLHAHHIIPYQDNTHMADVTENGIVLCHWCHWQVHQAINHGQPPGDALVATVMRHNQSPPVQYLGALLLSCNDKGGIEDVKKARHYIDKLIEVLEQK